MMRDDKLMKISLLVALIGIVMIYAVTVFVGPQQMAIKDIKEDDIGKQVVVNGTVENYRTSEGNIFIALSDGAENITVVMFERTARSQLHVYELKKGENIIVEGQVNTYKNELEIIASSIRKSGG